MLNCLHDDAMRSGAPAFFDTMNAVLVGTQSILLEADRQTDRDASDRMLNAGDRSHPCHCLCFVRVSMIDTERIWSSSQLPSLPSAAVKLLELSKDPEAGIEDFVAVIRTDPALVAKFLRSINSSYFGFRSQIASIEKTVTLLGMMRATMLALSFSIAEQSMTSGSMKEQYESYWLQSIVQASAAEVLAEYARQGLTCEFFLVGLLMDIGRLAMLKTIPEEYRDVLESADQIEKPLWILETETLGINHIEVSTRLLENWNLPGALIKSVRFQHAPLDQLRNVVDDPFFELIKTSAIASAVGDSYCSSMRSESLALVYDLTETFCKFSTTMTADYLARIHSRLEQLGDLFSVDVSGVQELDVLRSAPPSTPDAPTQEPNGPSRV